MTQKQRVGFPGISTAYQGRTTKAIREGDHQAWASIAPGRQRGGPAEIGGLE